MERYYADVRENEIKISKQEEWALIAKAQSGCSISRSKVINANARFVIDQAKRRRMDEYLPDLIQAGNIGLITALDRFDLTKKIKFISYAVWWIRQSINEWLTLNYRTIRIPANVLTDISNGKYEAEEFASTSSLSEFTDDIGFLSHSDTQPDFELSRKDVIEKILQGLNENQREVIKYRIGFYDDKIYSYKAIAKKKKCTLENCRTHYHNGIKKIKKQYTKEQLTKIFTQ